VALLTAAAVALKGLVLAAVLAVAAVASAVAGGKGAAKLLRQLHQEALLKSTPLPGPCRCT